MSVPLWVLELAEDFWAGAGGPSPFPRDLLPAVRRSLPVSVVELSTLGLDSVGGWLTGRGLDVPLPGPDRRLRGCLVACRGSAFLFVDAGDADAERRFTLAHEVAHFLRHYAWPRRRAAERLGPAALEVLDGDRPPSPVERLHALLRGVPVGPFVHLLDREGAGALPAPVAAAEREADRLAFELLAPADLVLAEPFAGREALGTRLVTHFGLPARAAQAYAELLRPPAPAGGLADRLKIFP